VKVRESASRREFLKIWGTCEKRFIFFEKSKFGRFKKKNLFSPKNFMIFLPQERREKSKSRKNFPKNI